MNLGAADPSHVRDSRRHSNDQPRRREHWYPRGRIGVARRDPECQRLVQFHDLRSRKHDHQAQLYAFDILGARRRGSAALPLSMQNTELEHILRGAYGIFVAQFG